MTIIKTILLLEDDKNLNKGITLTLQKEQYIVASAYTIKQAKEIFQSSCIDMVISDITLPDGDGLSFGKWVRQHSNACLIYLTAMDSEIDIVNGYATGADDYVTKPFSLTVLTSKVNAIMRRMDGNELPVLESEGIELHLKEGTVMKDGEPVILSKTEFQLLLFFMENANQILSKEQILNQIWGNDGQFVDDNTVTVNISRLKNKLGIDRISNVRGLGYLWDGQVKRK